MIYRYAVVGGIGTALHFGLLVAFVEWFGWPPVLSSVIGFLIVLAISYVLNKSWTFRQRDEPARIGQMLKYAAVSGLGLLLNAAIMHIAVDRLHWHYMVGQCAVVAIVPASNYALNRWWTFRPGSGGAGAHRR